MGHPGSFFAIGPRQRCRRLLAFRTEGPYPGRAAPRVRTTNLAIGSRQEAEIKD
jgi:hypothetical protein